MTGYVKDQRATRGGAQKDGEPLPEARGAPGPSVPLLGLVQGSGTYVASDPRSGDLSRAFGVSDASGTGNGLHGEIRL